MQDYIILNYNWLKLKDYQFKILILIKMLATDKEQITYKGTLQDMREWLNLGDNTKNNKRIRKAIEELSQIGIITYKPKSERATKYTITILDKKTDNNIINNVKKEWINNIRNYNADNKKRIIETMIKVLLYAYDNEKGDYKTREDISYILNITTNQLDNAIKNLLDCHFLDYSLFHKDLEKVKTNKGNRTKGIILQFVPNGIYKNN